MDNIIHNKSTNCIPLFSTNVTMETSATVHFWNKQISTPKSTLKFLNNSQKKSF